MAGTIDPALTPGGDAAQLIVRIGTWADEAEGRDTPVVADAVVYPKSFKSVHQFVRGTIEVLGKGDFNPWAHNFQVKSFYAGASSESWGLAVHIAPLIQDVLSNENLRLLAGSLLGAVFGNLLKIPSWMRRLPKEMTLAEASKTVLDYVVWRDDVAPGQIEELTATELDDGSFELHIRRETDGHEFLFRIDKLGSVVARLDLNELVAFTERSVAAANEGESND